MTTPAMPDAQADPEAWKAATKEVFGNPLSKSIADFANALISTNSAQMVVTVGDPPLCLVVGIADDSQGRLGLYKELLDVLTDAPAVAIAAATCVLRAGVASFDAEEEHPFLHAFRDPAELAHRLVNEQLKAYPRTEDDLRALDEPPPPTCGLCGQHGQPEETWEAIEGRGHFHQACLAKEGQG